MSKTKTSDHELVRRLLAIARDPGASQAERDSAQLRASALMARLMITELDLEDGEAEQITTRDIILKGGRTTASAMQVQVLHRIAEAAGASTYWTDRRHWKQYETEPGPHIVTHVVGYPSDLDQLMPLLSTVLVQAAAGWSAWTSANKRRYRPMKPITRRATRDGYLLGWGNTIADRVRAARATAIDERDQATPTGQASTALTVRSREQRISDYLDTLNLTPCKNIEIDDRAYHDGQRDALDSGLATSTRALNNQHHLLEGGTTS